MSKAAWTTLGLSCTFTTSLIYLVHRQQRVEKKVKTEFSITRLFFFIQAMRAGIEAEDEKRRFKVVDEVEAEETKKRLERNFQDFELQQKLTKELLKE